MKTSPADRRRSQQGFTLVELLVTITIIGLVAGAAVLAIPDPRGSLAAEAERFAAHAKAARDQATIGGRAVALSVSDQDYSVARRANRDWSELERQEWRDGTEVGLAAGAEARTVFDPTGLADPLQVTLRRGDQRIAVDIGHDGAVAIRR